ncbi:S8 family serine peptidase [Streptomyces sp. NPDC046977]|uniref:S8 family serine peptidase n=1 Tax=Streptomyces sp. NPDC046977 TaxID=3154703 RepID=UPI00340B77D0
MAPLPGRRRALAIPIGMVLAGALAFLPNAASAAAAGTAPGNGTAAAADGPVLSYVVNTTRTNSGTIKDVQQAVDRNGGDIVATYKKIGVIVVHSANPSFAAAMRTVRGVESAGATRTAALSTASTTELGAPERITAAEAAAARSKAGPAQEPLEADQWDLAAIGADKAARIDPGDRHVTVAVIDTGVDDTHPDLAANFSAKQSANCVGGVADTSPGAWRPYSADAYHGTHVAGEIAAARNGIGVAGVAPGVRVASIKVADPVTQLFYPESVVCAFVFAAENSVEITNNSYYVDPWLYNCLDDPDQRAIVDAVERAARYSEDKGVLNIASAGNSNHDLDSTAIVDTTSPDDSTPVTRTVDPHVCWDIPTQLPGVVTVSATGVRDLKSYYSSYGLGVVDVAAPGGDRFQVPGTPSANGRILSTLPGNTYGWLQGTSMASPHVAGVAALLKSTHRHASPEELQEMLKAQADNPGCPTGLYDPDGNGVQDATCTGGPDVNSFYGHGIVDALDAVTG